MNTSIQPAADTPLKPVPFDTVIASIRTHGEALRLIPGVLGVRPGLRIVGGELTQEPVIVLVTQPEEQVGELPGEVAGIPVQTRKASPLEILEGLSPLSIWEGLAPEAAPLIHYVPPDPSEVTLAEIRVNAITCHVGPDSGWPTLEPFLEGATKSL